MGLATLILEGRTPQAIRPLFFGAKLMALSKRCVRVRPIAVGCSLRSLGSKCACLHALQTIPQLLAPINWASVPLEGLRQLSMLVKFTSCTSHPAMPWLRWI